MKANEVHLISRPKGGLVQGNLKTVEVDLKPIRAGEFLVHNRYMSVDPYMLGRMQGTVTYSTPFELGAVMDGEAIGQIVESRHSDFPVGEYVQHWCGWRDRFVSDGQRARLVKRLQGVSLDAHLDILGRTTGLAAWAGLFDIADLQCGEAVFVSAAAGAVGLAVCQMALALGCHVVGSAGSTEKVAWLEQEIGIHRAVNYRDYTTTETFEMALLDAFPKGIDVLFENVGGMSLEAALWRMNNKGRVAMCGMIAYYEMDYNRDRSINTGPRNFIQIAERWLKVQGFSAPHYEDRIPEFEKAVGDWIRAGKIKPHTTIIKGLENTVEAMTGVMTGTNFGKMVIEI